MASRTEGLSTPAHCGSGLERRPGAHREGRSIARPARSIVPTRRRACCAWSPTKASRRRSCRCFCPKIDAIPFGKGIAGCAAERKDAVQLCNLQEDLGGVAKPEARKTNVQGALAVPILGGQGQVLGVLGVGKMAPYDFTEAEIADLKACAALIAGKL